MHNRDLHAQQGHRATGIDMEPGARLAEGERDVLLLLAAGKDEAGHQLAGIAGKGRHTEGHIERRDARSLPSHTAAVSGGSLLPSGTGSTWGKTPCQSGNSLLELGRGAMEAMLTKEDDRLHTHVSGCISVASIS